MSVEEPQHVALIRYSVPDRAVPPSQRKFYAFPAHESTTDISLPLHDARTSSHLTKGKEGLDVHGFAYIKHATSITNWFEGTEVEDAYLRETEKLVCQVTGAKQAVASSCAFRRKIESTAEELAKKAKQGGSLALSMAKMRNDRCNVIGKIIDASLEPARVAHVDYSLQGLKDSVRYSRRDIAALAQEALEAEDAGKDEVPRYAVYSIWRPLLPVKRDPLAVLDWQSLDTSELELVHYRIPSDVTNTGEYINEAISLLPPKEPAKQRWFWAPEQQPDEVLFVKFADTGANGSMAQHCVHESPTIPGTENEEARCSIEVRVMAFW